MTTTMTMQMTMNMTMNMTITKGQFEFLSDPVQRANYGGRAGREHAAAAAATEGEVATTQQAADGATPGAASPVMEGLPL